MKKKIKVFYLFPTSRSGVLQEDAPAYRRNNLFIGLDHLGSYGIKAAYSDYGFQDRLIPRIARYLSSFLRRFFRFPVDFSHIIVSYFAILGSDVIFATSQRQGLPLLLFKYFGLVGKKVVFASIGFTETLKTGLQAEIGFLTKVFSKAEAFICYGWQERQELISLLNLDERKVIFIPFGVNIEFLRPSIEETKDFVLSGGIDPQRDYQTLFEAMDGLPVAMRLFAPQEYLGGLRVPENVKVDTPVAYLRMKDFYAQSRFVVISVKDNSYTAGTTMLLEAMAMAKAVVVSKTGAIKDGYHLVHRENCLLATPGNVSELREAIQYLYAHPDECKRIGANARKTVEEYYAWSRYVGDLAALFTRLAENASEEISCGRVSGG